MFSPANGYFVFNCLLWCEEPWCFVPFDCECPWVGVGNNIFYPLDCGVESQVEKYLRFCVEVDSIVEFPVMRKLGSWEHQCSERKHEWNEEQKKTGILYRFSFERCHKFLVAKVFQPRFTTRNGDQVSWLPRPGVKRVANLGVKPAWEHSLCYAVVWNKSDLKHVGHYKIAKNEL